MPAPVIVAEYDPRWPARFARLRDRLRADPVAAAAYADLKRALAARFRHDRVAYTEGKTAFIDSLLAVP